MYLLSLLRQIWPNLSFDTCVYGTCLHRCGGTTEHRWRYSIYCCNCRDSRELQGPTHCPSPHTYPKLEFIPVHSFNSPCNVLLHTCDIPRSPRVLPLLTPLTRWSSRRAKFPAFCIFLSDFFANQPFFMSTVVYGITVCHIDL